MKLLSEKDRGLLSDGARATLEMCEKTYKKWADLGFLEGISGKESIAKLYEGQASFILKKEKNYKYLLIRS